MEPLKLYWMGQPIVKLKGRLVKLETRKAIALLAYLSLAPGENRREILATMFWPEGSQQKALANLRRTLASLNSSLPGWIDANRESIRLKRNAKVWVDVDVFQQSLSQRKEHIHSENEVCEPCLSILERTVELYRGDFLHGLNLSDSPGYDEWQFFQRDSLRQELADALQYLSSGYARQGAWDRAIACARRWVALDRLHEPARRALIDLYARSGQRTSALQQYEELTRLLQEQLGQEPEQETRQLFEQIQGPAEANRMTESPEHRSPLPLLKTKLYIPAAPASRVKRIDLINRLGEIERKALTIISAPAGFGKTTLLAEWIAHTQLPVAWLSLDNGDNDPYRFLSYLIEALESIYENLGREARQIMQSSQLVPTHIILASLINALGLATEPYVLILDDYQFITEQAVHETTGYLLAHLPSNLHVVIATRADPPLQLGRLRAYGQMLELRTQDLRFTSQEATEFLNEVMRLGLSGEDIQALEERTEGWVVGLQMAALSLKGLENTSEFIRAFSGSHRYVLDYLVEEVLNRQPIKIRTFLLRTSILEKICFQLCDSLLTEEESQEADQALSNQQILEYLERSNLFLIPLDDELRWFRYHHLFADLLQSRLRQLQADTVIKGLHMRASVWLEENNFPLDAIQHAITAEDFDRAARLVEENFINSREWNELNNIRVWTNQLPKEFVLKRPKLCSYHAYLEMLQGKLDGLETYLESAEYQFKDAPQEDRDEEPLGILSLTRAHLAGLSGDWTRAIKIAQRTSYASPKYSSACDYLLAMAFFVEGNLERSKSLWLQSIDVDVPLLSGSLALSYSYLARIYKLKGKLNFAEKIYADAMKAITQSGWNQFYVPALIEFGMADLLRERNEWEEAWNHVQHGLENTGNWFPADSLATGYAVKSRVLLLKGDCLAALSIVQEAEGKLKGKTLLPHIRSELDACSIRIWLALGKDDLVAGWLQDHSSILDFSIKEPGNVAFRNEYDRICALRILLAQRKFDQALSLAEQMMRIAKRGKRYGRVLEIAALQAIALQGLGRQEDALHVLKDSLVLAQPEGYWRVFLDEDLVMKDLLQRGMKQGIWQGRELRCYVERLLAMI